jgi:hypothetical protein
MRETGEGREEGVQDRVALPVSLILAAVVVDQIAAPLERQAGAVDQTLDQSCAARLDLILETLQEGGLAIPRVAGDQHQPQLAGEHRGRQLAVQRRLDIEVPPHGVQTARAAVAVAALAVEGQQIGDEGVGVGRKRSIGRRQDLGQ